MTLLQPCLGLLPDKRVTPKQVSGDLCAGRDFRGESSDMIQRRVRIALAVFLPGGAHFAWRFQSSIVNEPQAYADNGGDSIQHHVPHTAELQEIVLAFK